MTNSQRFIDAYNKTDAALHNRFGLKPSITYTDAVRRAATLNAVVRRYEDELTDYGRLRNAIVHKSNSKITIAEPHDDVTENFERIAEILSTPPKASTVAHEPCVVKPSTLLISAIRKMQDNGYSMMPIVDNGVIVGIFTNKSVVEFVAKNHDRLDEAFKNAVVADAEESGSEYYSVADDVTIDEAVSAFEKKRKMRMLILTDGGRADGKILGVLTVSDLVAMNRMLDSY